MGLQLEKIFLGNTPSEQRKFIVSLFKFLKDKNPKLVIPACGQFTLIKCAIEAGYKKKNISTSDISLFSSVLGYYYAGKPISDINFEILEPYREEYESKKSDTERLSYILWIMKLYQLRTDIVYENNIRDEIYLNKEKHLRSLGIALEKLREYYEGISYDIKDLRAEIEDKRYGDDALLIINPPAFRGGYQKMFAFEDAIKFDPNIEEFDLKKEYNNLYDYTKKKPYVTVWYRYKEVDGFNKDEVIFAKEYSVDRFDYWLITKPKILKGFENKGLISYNNRNELHAFKNVKIWSDEDELKKDSTVRFVDVPQEIALYYRDLWAHKLGNTKAEHYFLILLDGKIFATVGFHTSELFRLKSDKVFENYGFSAPSKKYKKLNRLMMYLITCKEMGDVLHRTASKINRIYDLRGLKTTCLSKYRKVKLNNGILRITKKEKMKDGVYKLMYETDWHDRTFKDCVNLFLSENNEN